MRKLRSIFVLLLTPALVASLSATWTGRARVPTSVSVFARAPAPRAIEVSQREGPASLVTVEFATARDGVVVFTRGLSGDSDVCVVETAVTTDGGRSFRPPIVLASTEYGDNVATDCGFASVALAPSGSGWAVVAGQLWAISDDWRTWQASPAFAVVLGTQAVHFAACGVVAQGTLVMVTACLSNKVVPSLLLRSTNQGSSWTVVPITAWAGGWGAGSGAQMALASSRVGAVFGCVTTKCSRATLSSFLDISTTGDAGQSWVEHKVCPDSDQGGFLAASASTLTVACLGIMSTGAQAITVLSSNNGGRGWSEMCANGFFGTWKKRAVCPWEGYVSSLVATSDGTLLMGSTRGGVYASTDGGAIWRLTLQTFDFDAGWPVDLASAGDSAWAVTGYGDTIGVSTNGGRTWTVLPFRKG